MKLIIDGKIWFGVKKWSENVYFIPGDYSDDRRTDRSYKEKDGEVMTTINICVWWTNIDHHQRRKLECTRSYVEGEYRMFDDTDIINIDDIRDIPKDYEGEMGVPLTFLERWDPEEFDVLGKITSGVIDGENKYVRLLIKRK